MEILLVAGYTALFLILIKRWKFFRIEFIPAGWVRMLFVLKVMAGCLLGLIYTYYYTDRNTADTFKFFDDSKVLFWTLFDKPLQFFQIFFGIGSNTRECFEIYAQMSAWNNQDVLFNDNKTLVRLNVLFQFFSMGHYYVHVVFLNFFSFTGLIALFRLFQLRLKQKSRILFIVMMFLPSVIFWGSGLLKDGLLLFALGLLLYSFQNLLSARYSFRSVIAFSLCLLLLMFTKLYVLFIIIPGLIAWYWSRNSSAKTVIAKFIACYFAYVLLGFNIDKISEKFDVVDLIYYKQQNFNTLARTTGAKSVISIPTVEPRAISLLAHAPAAVGRVFLRPSLADNGSPLVLMAAVENLFILLFGAACLLFSRLPRGGSIQLLCFSCFFIVCMYALIGLITPILGAMVRYKVPALLFLVYVFMVLVDDEKVKSKFPLIQKHM